MLEIAGLLVAGVSALGTLVQAYYAARKRDKKVSRGSLRRAEDRAETPLQIGAKRVAEVIDPELLVAIQKEIEICNQKLIAAFRDRSGSEKEREKLVEEARRQICKFLRQVLKYNDDLLPTQRLRKLWMSNRCVNE